MAFCLLLATLTVRYLEEESTNRDGHWVRDFTSRAEPWPILEAWTVAADYRLTAVKGQRRLYTKGNRRFYQSSLEIRVDPDTRRVVLAAWVEAGWWPRVWNLFQIPREMNPEPSGWWGARPRRALMRELNTLLSRFRQPEIVGSHGFHLLDLDLSVLWLSVGTLALSLALLAPELIKLEIRAGLTNPLLKSLGMMASRFALFGLFAVGLQWTVTKKWGQSAVRWSAASALAVLFSLASVSHWTFRATEAFETRFAHHCLHQDDERRCRTFLSSLTPKERERVLRRIRKLEKELAYGPARPR